MVILFVRARVMLALWESMAKPLPTSVRPGFCFINFCFSAINHRASGKPLIMKVNFWS